MNPLHPSGELDELLKRPADGELTIEQRRRLMDLTRGDPAAVERYTDYG